METARFDYFSYYHIMHFTYGSDSITYIFIVFTLYLHNFLKILLKFEITAFVTGLHYFKRKWRFYNRISQTSDRGFYISQFYMVSQCSRQSCVIPMLDVPKSNTQLLQKSLSMYVGFQRNQLIKKIQKSPSLNSCNFN